MNVVPLYKQCHPIKRLYIYSYSFEIKKLCLDHAEQSKQEWRLQQRNATIYHLAIGIKIPFSLSFQL